MKANLRRRTRRIPGALWGLQRMWAMGLGLTLLLASGNARASEMLEQLGCVYLNIDDVGSEARDAGVTPTLLLAALKVGVTENLPRLAINDSCDTDLYLSVGVVPSGSAGGRTGEYTAVIRLEIRRLARVIENDAQGMVTVWDASSILVSRGDKVSLAVSETIRDLAAELGTVAREAARR